MKNEILKNPTYSFQDCIFARLGHSECFKTTLWMVIISWAYNPVSVESEELSHMYDSKASEAEWLDNR